MRYPTDVPLPDACQTIADLSDDELRAVADRGREAEAELARRERAPAKLRASVGRAIQKAALVAEVEEVRRQIAGGEIQPPSREEMRGQPGKRPTKSPSNLIVARRHGVTGSAVDQAIERARDDRGKRSNARTRCWEEQEIALRASVERGDFDPV